MKHRIFNPRGRQIEIVSSKNNYLKINEVLFSWILEYKNYGYFNCLKGTRAHFSISFDAKNPYVIRIIQIWYYTKDEFIEILKQIHEISKGGLFKEIWIGDPNFLEGIVCDNFILDSPKIMALLKGFQLLNLRQEGDIIKWDINYET